MALMEMGGAVAMMQASLLLLLVVMATKEAGTLLSTGASIRCALEGME
jgi:hypothetical protein